MVLEDVSGNEESDDDDDDDEMEDPELDAMSVEDSDQSENEEENEDEFDTMTVTEGAPDADRYDAEMDMHEELETLKKLKGKLVLIEHLKRIFPQSCFIVSNCCFQMLKLMQSFLMKLILPMTCPLGLDFKNTADCSPSALLLGIPKKICQVIMPEYSNLRILIGPVSEF